MAKLHDGYSKAPTKPSPIDREIAALDGTYYKLSEVAEKVGVSESSLRLLIRNKTLDIPSKTLVMGRVYTYLFTPEDVESIKKHYAKRQKLA